MTYALVLLSGGMDSAVALFWAAQQNYKQVDALTFDYGQVAARRELSSSVNIWSAIMHHFPTGVQRKLTIMAFSFSGSSVLGRSTVDKYDNVEDAIRNTSKDKSYIPLRNAVLVTIAAGKLLTVNPKGGDIITGIRGREGGGGFPDCTHRFAELMSASLTEAAGVPVNVVDPLNQMGLTTRKSTVEFARSIPGCFEALRHSYSCFTGNVEPCGHCLPCLRRAQAFAGLGIKDPALET